MAADGTEPRGFATRLELQAGRCGLSEVRTGHDEPVVTHGVDIPSGWRLGRPLRRPGRRSYHGNFVPQGRA